MSSNDFKVGSTIELDGAPWRIVGEDFLSFFFFWKIATDDDGDGLSRSLILNLDLFRSSPPPPRIPNSQIQNEHPEHLHVKPGKGAAFVRTKLKNYVTGGTMEKTFRGGEPVNTAEVFRTDTQYTYADGDDYVFMDNKTYEETRVKRDER